MEIPTFPDVNCYSCRLSTIGYRLVEDIEANKAGSDIVLSLIEGMRFLNLDVSSVLVYIQFFL